MHVIHIGGNAKPNYKKSCAKLHLLFVPNKKMKNCFFLKTTVGCPLCLKRCHEMLKRQKKREQRATFAMVLKTLLVTWEYVGMVDWQINKTKKLIKVVNRMVAELTYYSHYHCD